MQGIIQVLRVMAVAVALAVVLFLGSRFLRPLPPVVPTPSPTPVPTKIPEVFALNPVSPVSFEDDRDAESLKAALEQSLAYYRRKDPLAAFPFGATVATAGRLQKTLEATQSALNRHGLSPAFYRWLSENVQFFESSADSVLFTGYHLASLNGSFQKTKRFRYPIYKKPKDLIRVDLSKFDFYSKFPGLPRSFNGRVTETQRLIPYYSRGEIDFQGQLKGQNLELLWGDSLVDIHSLHVQGSGVVTLPDGSIHRIGFADSNGLKFTGVGGYLLRKKMIRRNQASYQGVQAYLKAHPKALPDILSANARYIFFRKLKGGPKGSLGVEVTPHRSIATDSGIFPKGALALIQTEHPVFNSKGKLTSWKKFWRLVFNQDTGSAIKGTGRVDLYHGYGEANEKLAGSMHQRGRLLFLLGKQ